MGPGRPQGAWGEVGFLGVRWGDERKEEDKGGGAKQENPNKSVVCLSCNRGGKRATHLISLRGLPGETQGNKQGYGADKTRRLIPRYRVPQMERKRTRGVINCSNLFQGGGGWGLGT